MNKFDVKRNDSLSYWLIKDFICINTHQPLRAYTLKFNILKNNLV